MSTNIDNDDDQQHSNAPTNASFEGDALDLAWNTPPWQRDGEDGDGETVAGTTEDDYHGEKTVSLPETARPDQMTPVRREIVETAVIMPEASQSQIADAVGCSATAVSAALRLHHPAHPCVDVDPDGDHLFECEGCGDVFAYASQLESHHKGCPDYFGEPIDAAALTAERNESKDDEDDSEPEGPTYECRYCGEPFGNRGARGSHQQHCDAREDENIAEQITATVREVQEVAEPETSPDENTLIASGSPAEGRVIADSAKSTPYERLEDVVDAARTIETVSENEELVNFAEHVLDLAHGHNGGDA